MSDTGENLLSELLEIREQTWSGRGKYKIPVEPKDSDLPTLPGNWTWASADQLTAFVTDGEHQTPERADTGVLLLSARNVHNGQLNFDKVDYVPEHEFERISKRLVVQEGDVLLSCSGTVGRTCVAPPALKFTLVRSVAVLRPFKEMGKFMSYALQSPFLQAQINEKKSQTAQANIFQGKIKTLSFPLPPLPEQRRIVARIEELFSRLDAGVAALRHAKAQLQRYRQSVLAAAVTGQLTQAWREQHPDTEPAEELLERILDQRREQWNAKGKYKEPNGFNDENPFHTPPSWALTTFEQVSRRVTVGHVGSMKDEYTESGVPFLRGQNVRANRFDPKGLRFVSSEFHKSLAKSTLQGGDIAVTRSGDVGIACVIPDDLGEANCSDLVLVLGPILIDPNYAAYYMNSLGRRLVQKGKVGVAITHFNTKSVAAMPLPLPPLAEQHQIVAEVEARTTAIDHLEAELDRQITRSNRLRQSTLASAFSGHI